MRLTATAILTIASALTLSCSQPSTAPIDEVPLEEGTIEDGTNLDDENDGGTGDETPDPLEPEPDLDEDGDQDEDGTDDDQDETPPDPDLSLVERIDIARSDLKASRNPSEAVASTAALDYGTPFYIGDGVDVLNGKRVPSCFDPEQLEVREVPLKPSCRQL